MNGGNQGGNGNGYSQPEPAPDLAPGAPDETQEPFVQDVPNTPGSGEPADAPAPASEPSGEPGK